MARYVVVHAPTQTIQNLIEWDGETTWEKPQGHITLRLNNGVPVEIGWKHANGEFSPPDPPGPPGQAQAKGLK